MALKLWGFTLGRDDEASTIATPIMPANDDGAVVIDQPSTGVYVDLDASYRSELDLLQKYRQMALQPEMSNAIDDIVDEAIVHDNESSEIVKVNLDKLDVPTQIKKQITNEFGNVLNLLNFNNFGDDIFRKWYIDGRLYYNVVIDPNNPDAGIQTLQYIDSRKIKKVRQVQKQRDEKGAEIITGVEEFYIYNDKLLMNNPNSGNPLYQASVANGIKLSADSVVQVTSGIYDPIKGTVLSYLHKAIRPMNQLRFLEDATVIYRVTRAPERRVFYIGTGGLNRQKSEQYMKDMMTKFRNKLTYDPGSGQVIDDRRHIAMLEDFWLQRREGDKTTEIQTLPAGQNLGQIDDVLYFQKQLYRALGIPASRIENPAGLFNIGESGQITRDEIKFDKAVVRLRSRFSILFDELMARQLSLKKVCTRDEWGTFKQFVFYEYKSDNNFAELKEQQLLNMRADTMTKLGPFMGVFFSKLWAWKRVWQMDDEEIEAEQTQLDKEHQAADALGRPALAGFQPQFPPGTPEGAIPGTDANNVTQMASANPGQQAPEAQTPQGPDINDQTRQFVTGK